MGRQMEQLIVPATSLYLPSSREKEIAKPFIVGKLPRMTPIIYSIAFTEVLSGVDALICLVIGLIP